jgi:hypothetical protein
MLGSGPRSIPLLNDGPTPYWPLMGLCGADYPAGICSDLAGVKNRGKLCQEERSVESSDRGWVPSVAGVSLLDQNFRRGFAHYCEVGRPGVIQTWNASL